MVKHKDSKSFTNFRAETHAICHLEYWYIKVADKNETLVTSEVLSRSKYTGKHLLKPKQKYDRKTF